jgi:uncharacterized protein YdaU (DUF1376 family)
MPSDLHYMPFCHRDYLSSSTVCAMSMAAQGIYVKLMCHQFEDESLHPNPSRLMRTCGASPTEWAEFEPFLDECFPIDEDGRRRNDRIAIEREQALHKVAVNRQNGSRGGRPRKTHPQTELYPNDNPTETEQESEEKPMGFVSDNPRQADGLSESEPNPNLYQSQNQSNTSPPTPQGGETQKKPKRNRSVFADECFDRFCAAYPKRHGNLNRTAARAKFETKIRNGADPEEIIAAAERYKQFCDAEGKTGTEYVAMMSTWINQERWKDDLPEPDRSLAEGKRSPGSFTSMLAEASSQLEATG